MNTFWPRLNYLRQRAGWPLLLLVLLAVGMLMFHTMLTRPLQGQLAQLQQQAQQQERDIVRLRYQRSHPVASPQLRLQRFYRAFPHQETAPLWLEKIYAAAEAQQLALPRGDYKVLPDRSGQLLRYEVQLPVRGSYGQLRAFVAQLLAENPTLLLANLRFKRDSIGQPQLDAAIHLVLLLRES
ncbi:hypothetical protein [Vogesella indigofera]|uniref:hypothetical protein n=1 Tax=Vogesella indigofera TaxID=45465 RepID=UPI00234EF703|nr:hypothetical protein [Vogesella indigofera]MDC7707926.1 hypothetical protein [Vogesella indigofera]